MTKPVKYCPNCGYNGDELYTHKDSLEGLTVSRFTCDNCNTVGEAYIE